MRQANGSGASVVIAGNGFDEQRSEWCSTSPVVFECLEKRHLMSGLPLWSVQVVTPDGTRGSAAIMSSGRLSVRPQYDSDGDGTALVEAATEEEAARIVLTGSITRDFRNWGPRKSDSPDTVTLETAWDSNAIRFKPGKPGKSDALGFEDLYDDAKRNDRDFNDHNWALNVAKVEVKSLTVADPERNKFNSDYFQGKLRAYDDHDNHRKTLDVSAQISAAGVDPARVLFKLIPVDMPDAALWEGAYLQNGKFSMPLSLDQGTGNWVLKAGIDANADGKLQIEEVQKQVTIERDQVDKDKLTIPQLLNVYKLAYGQNDFWLQGFLDADGAIRVVDTNSETYHASKKVWYCKTDTITEIRVGKNVPVIEAVVALRQRLLEAAADDLDVKNAAIDLGFPDNAERFTAIRKGELKLAAQGVKTIVDLYLSGVGIFNEGYDLVMTVNEVAHGNLAASIGFLPFVPCGFAKTTFRVTGLTAVFDKATGVLRLAENTSGLGFVVRDSKGVFEKVINVLDGPAGKKVLVYGTPQATKTAGHAEAILAKARKMAASGEYEYITFNRSWRTATGRASEEGLRPDIIGVRWDGKVDAVEILSRTDKRDDIIQKLEQGRSSLPANHRGEIFDYRIDQILGQ